MLLTTACVIQANFALKENKHQNVTEAVLRQRLSNMSMIEEIGLITPTPDGVMADEISRHLLLAAIWSITIT